MPGDYMRLTFNPKDDHAGVLMQQGRVLLDADWNELVELLERRWRAETTDIIGRCAVPRETPDGFRITAAGGTLTIGRGRIYVHGLLAENHGTGPTEYDPILGELRGTQPTPYDQQLYLPNAPALPAGGPHLAYVDVWQREVTAVEDPDLIEKAVGVDTATRLQTVWQVKLLDLSNAGSNVTCDTPDEEIPGWLEITAPSAGRLSTTAVGVPSSEDPCFIPPNGGYRGAENRLYRVEIHQSGPLGTATFKWSRDNASVATNVTAINAAGDQLTVVQTGRDAVLRFSTDDWVEVTDDRREFAGQPGEMRKVLQVDDVAGTIRLTAALPAGAFDPADPGRHTRVRRWDQRGLVRDPLNNVVADVDASGGVIPVPAAGPATQIVLEDGVQITFDLVAAGGTFHAGDYWVFAARTVDASVEILDQAPPRGIVHHYCRLAIVTFPDTETDCRVLWPPETVDGGCDCSVCVTPQSHNTGTLTIQRAIDEVKAAGGKVCLHPGTYNLGDQPIRIDDARSVRITGKGWTTVLVYLGSGPAITVERSIGVTIEELSLLTLARGEGDETGNGIGMALRSSAGVTIQRCNVLQQGRGERGVPAIALEGALVETFIRENLLMAGIGIGSVAGRSDRLIDTIAPTGRALITANLYAEDNVLWCRERGISLDGFCLHLADTRLAGNTITGARDAGIIARGAVYPQAWGGSRLDIKGNTLRAEGIGIVVGTDETRIEGNDIGPANQGGDGILITRGLNRAGPNRLQILSNRIIGVGGHGIAIGDQIQSAMIKQNFVEAVGGSGIYMTEESQAGDLSVENNQLLNIAPQANEAGQPVAGIQLVRVAQAEIASNKVIGVGRAAVQNPSRTGILVVASNSVRLTGNEVAEIGPPTEFVGQSTGMEIVAPFERVDVADNTIRRSREAVQGDGLPWLALSIRGTRIVTRAGDLVGIVPNEAGVYTIGPAMRGYVGFVPTEIGFAGIFVDRVVRLPRGREIVAVRGNLLETFGRSPAVRIVVQGACVFGDNRCLQTNAPSSTAGLPVGQVAAGAIVASANYLQGPREGVALQLVTANGPFTVIGNISSGPITVNGAALPAPWAPLNVIAP
jgi:hypothetical protein